MSKPLGLRPNLTHLRKQAKDLLVAFRSGDEDAALRFRDTTPWLASKAPALHDAQSVIAREYGFASFAELRAHVEGAHMSPEMLRALMQPLLSVPLPAVVPECGHPWMECAASVARAGRRCFQKRARHAGNHASSRNGAPALSKTCARIARPGVIGNHRPGV